MKKALFFCGIALLSGSLLAVTNLSYAGVSLKTHHAGVARIGEPAPAWTLTDTAGKTHSLKEYAGKFVVLEWTNHSCPYVQKHYRTGNMQALQKFAAQNGVIWFSIVSSAKGREGYETPAQGAAYVKSMGSLAKARLLDPSGKVGKKYGAKTTPDIMIVNPKGVLIYSGGIDDQPTTEDEDIKTAHNYVKAALTQALAGKRVSKPTAQPYGCAVRYADSQL